jgi:hypothetical protein
VLGQLRRAQLAAAGERGDQAPLAAHLLY